MALSEARVGRLWAIVEDVWAGIRRCCQIWIECVLLGEAGRGKGTGKGTQVLAGVSAGLTEGVFVVLMKWWVGSVPRQVGMPMWRQAFWNGDLWNRKEGGGAVWMGSWGPSCGHPLIRDWIGGAWRGQRDWGPCTEDRGSGSPEEGQQGNSAACCLLPE
jgi:hypothetical protein